MRRGSTRLIAVLALFALFAAACGADRDDDTATGGDGTTDGTAQEPADGDTDTDTDDETDTDGDTEMDSVVFGDDLAWPCGPGDASGATEQGVTDDSITIVGGDDRGFAGAPGLNKEQTDALEAFVEACNEMGGINGRTVRLVVKDAAIFNAQQVMTEACDEAFMLVGHG